MSAGRRLQRQEVPAEAGTSCVWAKGDLNPHVPKDTGT